MPNSTARHALQTPQGGEGPTSVPIVLKTLADRVDLLLPYVASSAPPPISGGVWYSTTDYRLYVSDGTTWTPLAAGYLYGEVVAATPVNLPTAGATTVPTGASLTLTLAVQRRVKIETAAQFQMAASGTFANYVCQAAYNSGSSATPGSAGAGATTVGYPGNNTTTQPTGTGKVTAESKGTALLSAGTYTFYPMIQRGAGGTATDQAINGYVAVYDAGPF